MLSFALTLGSFGSTLSAGLRGVAWRGLPWLTALVLPMQAGATAYTLHVDGKFNGLASAANWSNPVYAELGRLVNGSANWGSVWQEAMSIEIDFDDALTVTPVTAAQSFYSMSGLTALRLKLGNASFSTSGLTAGSKIDFGLRETPPSFAAGDGFALALGQLRSRDSNGAYTLQGTNPQLSGNGLYRYYFSANSDLGSGPRLEIWTLRTADHKLAGGNPVAAWSMNGYRVTPITSAVPEAGSGLLLAAGLGVVGLVLWRRRHG